MFGMFKKMKKRFNKKEIQKIMDKKLDYKKAGMFLHCKSCLNKFLGSEANKKMSPRDFGSYEISDYIFTYPDKKTANILVFWCKRCGKSVWDSRFLTHLF